LASASSWRFGTSVGVGGQSGYQQTDAQIKKDPVSESYGLIVFQPTHVTTELFSQANQKRSSWDATSDQLYRVVSSESQVNMAVRGAGRVSVGLGVLQQSETSRGVLRTRKGFGGSFGFRVGTGFFVGLGVQRMREKVAQTLEKQWNDYLGGVALVYGDPDSSMFRLEVGGKASPLVSKGQSFAETHYKTQTQFGDLELLWSRWFGSVRVQEKKRFAALTGEKDQQMKQLKYGLGYRKLSFSLIFYRTLEDKRLLSQWYKERSFGATMGVGFF